MIKSILAATALLTPGLIYADICQFAQKLDSSVKQDYKPLIGKSDSRGRYFEPSVKLVNGIAKCRVMSLRSYRNYMCRWHVASEKQLDSVFNSTIEQMQKCSLGNKTAVISDVTKNSPRRNSGSVKWTNYSRRKITFGGNTTMFISKQTILFTKMNQAMYVFRMSFGAFAK